MAFYTSLGEEGNENHFCDEESRKEMVRCCDI